MSRPSALSINKYQSKAYDRIILLIKKGDKNLIKAKADEQGISMNKLIFDAVDRCYPGMLSPLDDTSKKKKA